MASGELGRRLAVAVVGIPLVLALIRLGGWPFGALLAAVAVLASGELFGLAAAGGARPFAVTGMAASGALVVIATVHPAPAAAAVPILSVLVALALLTLVGSVWLRWPGGEPLQSVAITLFGTVYVGGALAFAVFLREIPGTGSGPAVEGWAATGFILLPLVTTWVGDSAAYFVGRAWGRRKLFPDASPGKTVAGGVAGLLASALAGGLVTHFTLARIPEAGISAAAGALVGLVLGVVCPLGDVAESVLKREAGVKDSGHLLPGHGGFLDRIDALLFAFPVAYGLLALLGATR